MIDDERIWGSCFKLSVVADKFGFVITRVSDLSNLLVLFANMPAILCVTFILMPVHSPDKFYVCMRLDIMYP